MVNLGCIVSVATVQKAHLKLVAIFAFVPIAGQLSHQHSRVDCTNIFNLIKRTFASVREDQLQRWGQNNRRLSST